MGIKIDYKGKKFGLLTGLKEVDIRHGSYRWLFKCDCGKETVAKGYSVKMGYIKSCGCFWKSRITKHGDSRTRFYNIWTLIVKRCNKKYSTSYKRYGERGIKCEWNSFEEFKKDMHESYLKHVEEFGEKQTTIERNNPDGNYKKSNCRWATWKEQYANHSKI